MKYVEATYLTEPSEVEAWVLHCRTVMGLDRKAEGEKLKSAINRGDRVKVWHGASWIE